MWGARTHFSVGESILQPDDLLKQAKEVGYTHVAIADTMSVSAVIDLAKSSKKAGVEVITGCTLRVRHWDHENKYFFPKVYVKEAQGFVDLLAALSECETAKKIGRFFDWFAFRRLVQTGNFVVTTGDALSAFSSVMSDDDVTAFIERMRDDVSASQLVLELVAVASPVFARQNARVLSRLNGEHLIVNSMALYATEEDAKARDVVNAITRNLRYSHGATPKQVAGLFIRGREHVQVDFKESLSLANEMGLTWGTVLFSDPTPMLAYRWEKAPISIPKMAENEFIELVRQCKKYWSERIDKPVLGYKPDPSLLPVYQARLKTELMVLKELGFCGYFLLVADICRWAKDNGIAVGPGRGSVGGSLIAYVIGITEVDPIRFDLLFERFINPSRLDLPDADLDFMSERRHEIITYLRETYGKASVASISNYNTLGAPSALREVGKALDIPDRDYACSSYIPKEHGQSMSLAEALDKMPELQTYQKKHPQAFDIAQRVEGTMRSMGTHAAGVIVAGRPIKGMAVVEDRGEDTVVNWDKRVVEEQGLVKIDVLGLSNLDILRRAIDKIFHDYGERINLLDLHLDDEKTMAAFGRGETVGVFQFESGGMRKLLKDMAKYEPLTFEELAAATALFRPGPLDSGLLDDYVNVRQGIVMEHYEHPAMEPALKATKGVIVYQEQVMQLTRDLAGFTLAEADNVRKAIGKKDKDKMAEQGDKFVRGCVDVAGMGEDQAKELWDKIVLFAGYAFNKSHSVAYSIISVWTMYLKVHYPHAFYAASLEIHKEDKLAGLVADAAKRGIEILPPDVNESTYGFKRVGDALVAPISRVKGLSEISEKAVLDGRELAGGKFIDRAHFDKHVPGKCNKRQREFLEEVGAFASITPGALPARHPDRVKAQLERLPGLIAASVRVDRPIVCDGPVLDILKRTLLEMRDALGAPPLPKLGSKPKIMVILEAPSSKDEKKGKLFESDSALPVKEAIKAAGLTTNDLYITSFLKVPKKDKQITNEEIAASRPWLDKEIEILKPGLIIALGSNVSRTLCPDERGSIMDLAGKVVFDRKLDASIILGINPGMVAFDPAKQETLDAIFIRAAELIS